MIGKKTLYIVAIVFIIGVIAVISDVNNTYNERRELRTQYAKAVKDNETMRATIDTMSQKLKAREDENIRIREQEQRTVKRLESALQQSRVWASDRIPNNVADGLRAATSDER